LIASVLCGCYSPHSEDVLVLPCVCACPSICPFFRPGPDVCPGLFAPCLPYPPVRSSLELILAYFVIVSFVKLVGDCQSSLFCIPLLCLKKLLLQLQETAVMHFKDLSEYVNR